MKDEDAKHELRESESGQTGAKQKKDLQRSQPETPWKLIRREWYTTFSRAPARMEGLCRCTVREFSLQGCSFGPVDVLMQHRPIHMRRRDEDPSPSRCRLGRRGYPPASAAGWHGALDIQWSRGPRPGSRSGSFEPCRLSLWNSPPAQHWPLGCLSAPVGAVTFAASPRAHQLSPGPGSLCGTQTIAVGTGIAGPAGRVLSQPLTSASAASPNACKMTRRARCLTRHHDALREAGDPCRQWRCGSLPCVAVLRLSAAAGFVPPNDHPRGGAAFCFMPQRGLTHLGSGLYAAVAVQLLQHYGSEGQRA
jgi:hypothetical protein